MNVLNTHCVLKLNKNWQPFFVETGINALIDLYKSTVKALYIEYDLNEAPSNIIPMQWKDWVKLPVSKEHYSVGTTGGRFRIPTVVICENYGKIPFKRKKLNKQTLYERDGGICQYSGRRLSYRNATIDHILPRSRGGIHAWDNVVISHRDVNHKKGSMTLEESGLKLLKKPKEPVPVPAAFLLKNEFKVRDWNYFLLSNSQINK